MKTEMAHNASLEGVKQFDQNNLKQVETQEKNPLPDPEGIWKLIEIKIVLTVLTESSCQDSESVELLNIEFAQQR